MPPRSRRASLFCCLPLPVGRRRAVTMKICSMTGANGDIDRAADLDAGRDCDHRIDTLKSANRKAAGRTIPGPWRRIRSLCSTIGKEECINFLRHGYASI